MGIERKPERSAMTFHIASLADSPIADAALEALLLESYVGGGFRRDPKSDFTAASRAFAVYRLVFADGAVTQPNDRA